MAKMQTEITVKPLLEGSADITQIFIDLILCRHNKTYSSQHGNISENIFADCGKTLENSQFLEYNMDKVFSCVRVE